MILFTNGKINLGLHVVGKREDGYHNLETVFYPVALQDALEIIQKENPGSSDAELTVSGLPVPVSAAENICTKAYRLLKNDFSELPPVKMHLHKVIPAGAGLGGGSSNGAFTLLLLNKKFHLRLPETSLLHYALLLGSDCPFFIKNKPCYATGRGENLEEINLDLSSYKFILVNPGIHISTGEAFAGIKPGKNQNHHPLKEVIRKPVTAWKGLLVNDFEDAIFKTYPEIASIKDALYNEGAVYAAMTGTGSTVYGIFPQNHVLQYSFPPHYFVKEC